MFPQLYIDAHNIIIALAVLDKQSKKSNKASKYIREPLTDPCTIDFIHAIYY